MACGGDIDNCGHMVAYLNRWGSMAANWSQNRIILAYLRKRRRIDPMTALRVAGCFRLSERIRELEAAGHEFVRSWNEVGKRYRVYTLKRKAA